MKKLFYILLFLTLSISSYAQSENRSSEFEKDATYAQSCNCESNFEWVKKTFEENDAGFQYIIDKKGQAAYDIHNQLFMPKIKAAKTLTECMKLSYEWLTFFRSGHIGIERLKHEPDNEEQTDQSASVYETFNIDIPKFEKEIALNKTAGYEGIWQTGAYKIGIKKDGEKYVGFIIKSDADTWKPGQVKIKIAKENGIEQSTFYMRDHSPVESGTPELIGINYLQIGRFTLKRLSPAYPIDRSADNYFKSIETETPYLEELNSTTLYLRIPSFSMNMKKQIDSVITANKEEILKTENLIIDLRGNGGGGDQSFQKLVPFLYTNPIRSPGVVFRSTLLNNKYLLSISNDTTYNKGIRDWAKSAYDKMIEHTGEFVDLNPVKVGVQKFDSIYANPKNVGIIINEGNASTTEQFLLAAKQSKKVKLFGVTTLGALDISNMTSVESPCKEFKLWYCLSKSHRIPGMTIDDIGLQPDYYLDSAIPQYKWVEFVTEVLSQK